MTQVFCGWPDFQQPNEPCHQGHHFDRSHVAYELGRQSNKRRKQILRLYWSFIRYAVTSIRL